MVVSLEAIFLTLFVLISHNRMSQEGDKRAQLDLQVNRLAEKETHGSANARGHFRQIESRQTSSGGSEGIAQRNRGRPAY